MKLIKKLFYIFLPIILGTIVGLLIGNNINYDNLIKPILSPPKILFPIMWSILYILIGISYYIYINKNNHEEEIYYYQLIINLTWSLIFFLLKNYLLSSIWILILDILVLILMYRYYKNNSKLSTYLLIPYLIWILFATYLTIAITFLN